MKFSFTKNPESEFWGARVREFFTKNPNLVFLFFFSFLFWEMGWGGGGG